MALIPLSRERRSFGRRVTAIHAWIKIQGRPPISCTIRDLSDGGASLELSGSFPLPVQFTLEADAIGTKYVCEVRHTSGNRVGVEFLKRPQR